MHNKLKLTLRIAAIAAIYTVFTLITAVFGLSGNNLVQIRLSEALCILPVFCPEAIFGLTVGCLISNLVTLCPLWDIVFGTLATLAGAVGTYLFRNNRFLAFACPIVANTLIVPITYVIFYEIPQGYPLMALCVFAGEFISCGILGQAVYRSSKRINWE